MQSIYSIYEKIDILNGYLIYGLGLLKAAIQLSTAQATKLYCEERVNRKALPIKITTTPSSFIF